MKSFDDCFGNTIEAWKPLQANGNTLLVTITNILNGNTTIPKDYSISDFIPEFDEELNFKIVFVNSRDEYEMVYETIDNSAAGKSKSDNYTSVLGGLGLLNVTTGETDLVEWTTSDMDRPLGLIDNNSIPKKVINAFISAEDKDFYNHFGIDYVPSALAASVTLQSLSLDRG